VPRCFRCFYRKLSAAGCSFAAEILDRGRRGNQNNSGTNSSRRLTKSHYTLLAKIAYLVKAVNQQDVIHHHPHRVREARRFTLARSN
jgi:hypothetical protein